MASSELEFSPYFSALSSFDFVSELGKGAFGSVRKAIFTPVGSTHAVKKITFKRCPETQKESFKREVEQLMLLNGHQFIVGYFGSFIEKNAGYIVMELANGNLREYIDMFKNGIGSLETVRLSRQVLMALAYCYDKHIIHRDLKPANVMMDANQNAKLGDFGLSRNALWETTLPLTPKVVTLSYRAPEILLGDPMYTFAVDMWSFGCCFAEMFTGSRLFTPRSEVDLLHQIFQSTGFPNEESWPGISSLSRIAMNFETKKGIATPLLQSFLAFWPEGIEFLRRLMKPCPLFRMRPRDALYSTIFCVPQISVFARAVKEEAVDGAVGKRASNKPRKATIHFPFATC